MSSDCEGGVSKDRDVIVDQAAEIRSADDGSSSMQNDHIDKKLNENVPNSSGSCRKRHRRGRNKGGKRHWRPYVITGNKRRQTMCGLSMAPNNTTQFIMENHEPANFDPDNIQLHGARDISGASGDSSEDFDSSDESYLEKEFLQTYESYHEGRLREMKKENVIVEFLQMQSKMEELNNEIHVLKNQRHLCLNCDSTQTQGPPDIVQSSATADIEVVSENDFQDMSLKLEQTSATNRQLVIENERLKRAMHLCSKKDQDK